jgi:hypothetical protein
MSSKYVIYSPTIFIYEDGSTQIFWDNKPQCASDEMLYSKALVETDDRDFSNINENVNNIIREHGKSGLFKFISKNIKRYVNDF